MIDGQLLYAPNQYTEKCYSGTDFQMYSFLNLLYICQLQAYPTPSHTTFETCDWAHMPYTVA